MQLKDFEQKLNELLNISAFKDYCPKGMIVEGKSTLKKGVTGVSLTLELIEIAIQKNADFIVVHHPHGFWDNQNHIIRGVLKQKLALLLQNQISVFAYHLPLDAHPLYGNNIQLALALGFIAEGGFLKSGSQDIGLLAHSPSPISVDELLSRLQQKVGQPNQIFQFGKSKIQKIGICTGAAPQGVEECIELGNIDAYITGEARENTQSLCKEEKINFYAAGHHNTEVFGVKALAELFQSEWGLDCEFVNLSNPV